MVTKTFKILASVLSLSTCLSIASAQESVPLPLGFTQLEWIQSTGSQVIDTWYAYRINTRITATISFKTPQPIGWPAVFGGRNRSYDSSFSYFACSGNVAISTPGYVRGENAKMAHGVSSMPSDTKISLVCEGLTAIWSEVGQPNSGEILTAGGPWDSWTGSLAIFGCKTGDGYDCMGAIRLYDFTISEDGVVVHDYVPCRNVRGEAGLWDRIDGRFLGKVNSAAASFICSDDVPVMLNYLESSGTQYVNTGYSHTAYSRVTVEFSFPLPQVAGYSCLFGGRDSSPYNNAFCLYLCSGNKNTPCPFYPRGDNDKGGLGIENFPANTHIKFCGDGLTGSWTTANDSETVHVVSATGPVSAGNVDMTIFAVHSGNIVDSYSIAKLYSFEIDESGQVVRRFVPYRTSEGTIGLYDLADHSDDPLYEPFYPNLGKGVFGWNGYAYLTNGATCCLHDGRLDAADDLSAYSCVEKVSAKRLDAHGKTSYPELKLTKGMFDLADGEVRHYQVDRNLTLVGGAVLSVDVAAAGVDDITAEAVVFESATAENPFLVSVAVAADADLSQTYVLIPSGVSGSGVANFVRSVGETRFVFEIQDGALLMRAASDEPVVAHWKGEFSSDLADCRNWACTNILGEAVERTPSAETTVYLPDGCVFNCPAGQSFVCKEIVLPPSLGGDCDWRGITAPFKGNMNLNGHRLDLSTLGGEALIDNSSRTGGNGYWRLEYIGSTAEQYVNTRYRHKVESRVKIDFSLPAGRQPSDYAALFGERDADYNNAFLFSVCSGNSSSLNAFYVRGQNVDGKTSSSTLPTGTKICLDCNGLTASWFPAERPDDIQSLTLPGTISSGSANMTMTIFGCRDGSTDLPAWFKIAMNLYSFTILEGTDVVRSFVPVRRCSDGELGLWEEVQGQFYANNGAGSFIAGPDVIDWDSPAGEVHIHVPDGKALSNDGVVFSGWLKVVKEGAGEFVANCAEQSYFGGTEVKEGTLVYGTSSFPVGPLNATVKVAAGATLDMHGQFSTAKCIYQYDLAGMVRQVGAAANGYNSNCRCFGDITLSGDATIKGYNYYLANPTKEFGSIAFNEYTLTLEMENGYVGLGAWRDAAPGGTLAFSGSGSGFAEALNGFGCKRTRVVVDSPHFLKVKGDWDVGRFEFEGEKWESNNGTPRILVFESYKAGAMRPPIVMQNESTLDLSGVDAPWSSDGVAPEALTNGTTTFDQPGRVAFADDATVYIDLGTRRVRKDMPVVVWDEASKPANLTTLTFKAIPNVNYYVYKRDDGVYADKGCVILIR